LDDTQNHARQAQIPVLQAEELQAFARRMVQAEAQGSIRDPALKDLLAKYGFEATPSSATPEAQPASPVPPAAGAP
jgi:hypothetical protein